MRSYVTLEGDGTVVGWPKGTNRFYEYRDSPCDEAVAAFRAKVLALYQSGKMADILTFTTPAIPVPSSGYAWQARNCSVVTTPTTGNPVISISVREVSGQTIITIDADPGTDTEANIMANGGGAEWGESQVWYPTTAGKKVFTFPFIVGLYAIMGRKVGVTDTSKYVRVSYQKTASSSTTDSGSTAPVNPAPAGASKHAEGPSSPALAGTDDEGRAFTTTTAPALPLAPLSLTANQADSDYAFTQQAARWQMDLGRFPSFTMGRKRIVALGFPIYRQTAKNLLVSRGNIIVQNTLTNIANRDPKDSYFFWSDATWTNASYVAANTGLSTEVRRQAAIYAGREGFSATGVPIPSEFASQVRANYHPFPANPQTAYEIGSSAYGQWSAQESVNNFIPELNFIDLETPDQTEYHDQFYKQFQLAMQDRWAADPNRKPYSPKFIAYAVDMFDTGFSYQSEISNATGVPSFYTNRHAVYYDDAWLATYAGGAIGVDSYLRTTVGRQNAYHQYNTNGTVKMLNGLPVYNDQDTSYEAYGLHVEVSRLWYRHNIYEMYGDVGKTRATHWHVNRDTKPVNRYSRHPSMTNVDLFKWFRPTIEGLGNYIKDLPDFPATNNWSPVAEHIGEGMTLLALMRVNMHIRWAANKPLHNPGENYTPNPPEGSERGADGIYEYFTKADHRMSLLPEMFNNDGVLVPFVEPYINNMQGDGNRETDKFLSEAILYSEGGIACFGIVAYWPCQNDTRTTLVEVWSVENGQPSPSQFFSIVGRDTVAVRWRLAAGFTGATPTSIRMKYTDLCGVVRTQTGDGHYI